MNWVSLAVILFGTLLAFLAIGMPIAFALGLIAVVGIVVVLGPDSLMQVAVVAVNYGTSFTFLCIPLFIFMAEVAAFSGFAGDAYRAAHAWLGRVPGGLAVASITACTGFAAITGSSVGNAATIGLIAVPEMIKRGYDRKLATGCVAAGGTLGILIPPSALMIIYGIIVEESIGKLFMAGIIPGLVISGLFNLYTIIWARRHPEGAPPLIGITWGEKVRALRGVIAMLLLMVGVLGSIYAGICTPSEAAAVGAFGALVISIIYRKLNWGNLRPAMLAAIRTSVFLFFIIFGAMSFGFLLAVLKVPQGVAQALTSLEVSRWVIMVGIQLMLIFLGMFLDPAGILVLTLPTIFPTIMALGFNPIWFGVVLTLNMEMGNLTPPLGLNLYVLKSIAPDVPLSDIIRGVVPYIFILALGLVLLAVFPDLALWLPSQMK